MREDSIQNTAELRSLNKKKILDALRKHEMLTKRTIAELTNLSFATVSSLANQMEEGGFIQRGGIVASNGGRTATLLSIQSNRYFLLAINFAIAGEVRMSLLNLNGQRMYEWQTEYQDEPYEAVLKKVARGLDALLKMAGVTSSSILGAAAAVPAIFDQHSQCIVNSTISILEGRPLAAELQNTLGMEVFIENESNLMVLASGESMDRIFLFIGEGLGIGVVSSGKLLTGVNGYGGEIGHMPLGHAGYRCYCGQTNCVETELSIGGFLKKYRDCHPEADLDEHASLVKQWEEFVNRCLSGDADALMIAKENGSLLGTLIALLVNLFDPAETFIGGRVEQISDILLPEVEKTLSKRLTIKRKKQIPIRFTQGFNRIIITGCGQMAYTAWQP